MNENGLKASVEKAIERLAQNKMCPKYQFERAVDVLISPFIEEWISCHFEQNIEYVTAEFPIKKKNNNQSTNADYLFKSDSPEWIIVELKTEKTSLREEQFHPYKQAANSKWNDLKNDILCIKDASTKNKKYAHQYNQISKAEAGDHNAPVTILFITPHTERPENLPPMFKWLNLNKMFTDFNSQKAPEMWSLVKCLGKVINA